MAGLPECGDDAFQSGRAHELLEQFTGLRVLQWRWTSSHGFVGSETLRLTRKAINCPRNRPQLPQTQFFAAVRCLNPVWRLF